MVLVQPALQIVLLIFACVTCGLVAPGVINLSGQVRLLASPTTNKADVRHNANVIALMITSPIGRGLLFTQSVLVSLKKNRWVGHSMRFNGRATGIAYCNGPSRGALTPQIQAPLRHIVPNVCSEN